MKTNKFIAAAAFAALCFSAGAQTGTTVKPDETVLLYGKTITNSPDPVRAKKIKSAGFEMITDNGLSGAEITNESGNLSNIGADARFDLYFPKNPNGQMVIVCPGGGYAFVSSYNEGIYVAEWMLGQGITVAVLKYRLPNGHWTVPLEDVHNTFRYCRAHAAEWGIDRIGVIGFSAGGHLAATAVTMYEDAVTRPDFGILIYPVITFGPKTSHGGTRLNLIGRQADVTARAGRTWEDWNKASAEYDILEKRYSMENQVTSDTPATFIALSSDDRTVPPANSVMFYNSLLAAGVPAEMHIYPYGGHGWGFSKDKYVGAGRDNLGYCRNEFEASLSRWLSALR